MKQKLISVYVAFVFLIMLVPSAGMLIYRTDISAKNQKSAAAPRLQKDRAINASFLSDAGAYFSDHFAFRQEMVTALSWLEGGMLQTSTQESVIWGKDGWLYYKYSLDDFLGRNLMTDRQLFDLAHTMAMIQQYAQQNGADFAFTVAPNKNSLYAEHMPEAYQKLRAKERNMQRLRPYLDEEQVCYVDLASLLSREQETLYFARDSHWNNKGASIAADAMLNTVSIPHESYRDEAYEVRRDHEGDLDSMLHPFHPVKEEEIYYKRQPQFSYVEDVESNFDPMIHTTGNKTSGSLLMMRDSFGNALLPFMAQEFEKAYFTRGIPYNLNEMFTCQATTLLIERAERFLPDMVQQAPLMQAPILPEWPSDVAFVDISDQITEEKWSGDVYTILSGKLSDDSYDTHSRIYIRINGMVVYEAFPVSTPDGAEGFQMMTASTLLLEGANQYELGISR